MKNNTIHIKFNKDLYSPQIIKATAKLYKNLADFEFSDGKKYTEVTLKNIVPEANNVIKDEFCNYVLHAMHSNR